MHIRRRRCEPQWRSISSCRLTANSGFPGVRAAFEFVVSWTTWRSASREIARGYAGCSSERSRIELPGGGPEVLLSDTVGFISDLPTELVAAFRATLEEVLAADLICHVRDISHPETEEQARDVAAILESLGVTDAVPPLPAP